MKFSPFDKVNNERVQLEKILRNNGFYKFSKDLIFIEADSTKKQKNRFRFQNQKSQYRFFKL